MTLKFRQLIPLMGLSLIATFATSASAKETAPKPAVAVAAPKWSDNYSVSAREAQAEQKMLLVHFYSPSQAGAIAANESRWFADARAVSKLDGFKLVHVPTDAKIDIKGQPTTLLSHAAFAALNSGAGIVVVDFAHKNTAFYGATVSALPFASGKYYHFQPERVSVLLDLPTGTLTQRSMIYAVRVHPEAPASTFCESCPLLEQEAQAQSQLQADILKQGHHNWDSRFQRISGQLTGYASPTEVVAESWPNQDMMDSCVDCVASWRQSPGHWSAVSGRHRLFGYDIRRGRNGIWYGTGIFAN